MLISFPENVMKNKFSDGSMNNVDNGRLPFSFSRNKDSAVGYVLHNTNPESRMAVEMGWSRSMDAVVHIFYELWGKSDGRRTVVATQDCRPHKDSRRDEMKSIRLQERCLVRFIHPESHEQNGWRGRWRGHRALRMWQNVLSNKNLMSETCSITCSVCSRSLHPVTFVDSLWKCRSRNWS